MEFNKNDFENEFSQRWLYHQCLNEILRNGYNIPDNKLVIKNSEKSQIRLLLDKYKVKKPFITLIPGGIMK